MRVAILDDYFNKALEFADWSQVNKRAEISVFNEYLKSEQNIIEALRDFEIIVGMRERTPFPRSTLKQLPNLQLLITTGGRNKSFDLEAAAENGVTVCCTGGVGSPTSELAWGLIISLMRDIPGQLESMRKGGWQTKPGFNLAHKTLGIVGLGNLGARMAKVGIAFDMNVEAWSQNLTDERAQETGVVKVSKEQLFSQADIITIHYGMSERSRGMIGAKELAAMKNSAYLVNTSRAPIIDQDALYLALETNQIAGAGLDVYMSEPLAATNRFRKLENVILTPHIGYVTTENHEKHYADVVENIMQFLNGEPIRILAAPD
tara:strand:- start:64 stop:1020 length:957 start_codon:yes stop_codon:yes gene_type:complete